jgi:SAM-dependent methyltransferase
VTAGEPAPEAKIVSGDNDEIDTLRRDVSERDSAISALGSEIARLKSIIAQRDEGIRFLRLELARLSPESADQREWWDEQFSKAWEINSGPAQSVHFMKKLIEGLKPMESEFLSAGSLRALDWGCATGDGLHVLVSAFPSLDGVGIDISQVAIEKARAKYPALTFIATTRGEVEGEFDVLVTSNCLEHLDAPLERLGELLQAVRWLALVLVPYRETKLIEGHKVSFTEDSFPASFHGFTKLYTNVLRADPEFWNGGQLLVVYGSARYIAERPAHRGRQAGVLGRLKALFGTKRDRRERHTAEAIR